MIHPAANRFARRMLPGDGYFAVRRVWRHLKGWDFDETYSLRFPDRRDLASYKVQDGVRLDVFWKVLSIGRGPAFSLFIHDEEVMRFDCFGPGEGHFHLALSAPGEPAESRLWFHEQNVRDQIDRSLFELSSNLDYFLERHPSSRVRGERIDPVQMKSVCDRARSNAIRFLETRPELSGLDD